MFRKINVVLEAVWVGQSDFTWFLGGENERKKCIFSNAIFSQGAGEMILIWVILTQLRSKFDHVPGLYTVTDC